MTSFLLVTTSKSLLLLDGGSGNGWRIDSGKEHYYGIARGLGVFYVGNRYRSNASTVPKEQERGRILVFDDRLRIVEEIVPPFALRDVHQLLVHHGSLWAACSFDDMVAIYDGRGWEQWYPLGEPQTEPRDMHHFNSLTGFGDQLCVVAHNWGAQTGKPSELFFFRLPDRSLSATVALGNQAHNAWLHGTELMTCSSGDGLLLGTGGSRIETGAFPRGVCRLGGETYVGLTEFVRRPERDASKGWIAVFDERWTRRRTIELAGEGMVTDLLALSGGEADAICGSLARETIAYPVLGREIRTVAEER